MKTIACCLLTYNHPDIVEQVLSLSAQSYAEHGIDIYLYDSSEDDATRLAVARFESFLPNVHYVDVKHISSGDAKFYEIIQGHYLPKHYDYIWPCKDRTFLADKTLDGVAKAIQNGDYDIVFAVDERDRWELRWPKVKDEYDDAVEFFSHYGQLTTNWVALIRKSETMIDSVNWQQLTDMYNLGDNNFNQTLSLFGILADMDKPKIRVIHNEKAGMRESDLPSAKSLWYDKVINIWVEKWIPAIFSLPDIYNEHKMAVIQSELGLNSLFGGTDSLVFYRDIGAITLENYNAIRDSWSIISPIPTNIADLIFRGQDDKWQDIMMGDFVEAFKRKSYDEAYFIFNCCNRLKFILGEKIHSDLKICFNVYRDELHNKGYSALFEGVDSVDALILKYYSITGNKPSS